MKWMERWRNGALAGRYRALSARERRLVAAGAVVGVAAILYGGVLAPVLAFHDEALARYNQQEAQFEWMLRNRAQAERGRGETEPAVRDQPLLTLIDGTAREFGLRLASYRSEGGGGVSVVVQQQAFDDILRWTEGLSSRHGLRVIQASIDGQGEGTVNARFVIR